MRCRRNRREYCYEVGITGALSILDYGEDAYQSDGPRYLAGIDGIKGKYPVEKSLIRVDNESYRVC